MPWFFPPPEFEITSKITSIKLHASSPRYNPSIQRMVDDSREHETFPFVCDSLATVYPSAFQDKEHSFRDVKNFSPSYFIPVNAARSLLNACCPPDKTSLTLTEDCTLQVFESPGVVNPFYFPSVLTTVDASEKPAAEAEQWGRQLWNSCFEGIFSSILFCMIFFSGCFFCICARFFISNVSSKTARSLLAAPDADTVWIVCS